MCVIACANVVYRGDRGVGTFAHITLFAMGKRWLVSIIIGLVAAVWGVYVLFFRSVIPAGDPLRWVPVDAAMVLSFPAAEQLSLLVADDSTWNNLLAYGLTQRVASDMEVAASFLPVSPAPADASMLVSVHKVSADDYGLLWVWSAPQVWQLPDSLPSATRQYRGTTLYEDAATGAAFVLEGKQLVFSTSVFLLEAAIAQAADEKPFPEAEALFDLRELADRNNRPKIYLCLPNLSALLSTMVDDQAALAAVSAYGGWVVADFAAGMDGIFLNGYFAVGDAPSAHPALLRPNTDATMNPYAVLPFNTAVVYELRTADVDRLTADLQGPARSWYDRYIGNWIGQSVVLAILEPFDEEIESDMVVIATATDVDLALDQLLALAAVQSGVAEVLPDDYKGFPLFTLDKVDGFEQVFGFDSEKLQQPAVTVIDQYIVLAAGVGQLKVLIERYLDQQTMALDMDYLAFQEKMTNDPAIQIYVNIGRSAPLLRRVGKANLDAWSQPGSGLFQYNPLGLQLTPYKEGMYLLSGYLQTGSNFQQRTNLLWKSELDTLLAGTPAVVRNHIDNSYELLLTDAGHQLYLMDQAGDVLWKRQLGAPVIGSITTVDYYRNGKIQYLFSTAGAIYLIDRNGEDVENFPLRLPSPVSSGLSVIDYDNSGDFRMFIGCENGQVYGFYKSGRPLPGWSPMRQAGVLRMPVQHYVAGRKDYLITVSEDGKLTGYARNGTVRIGPVALRTAFSQPFFVDPAGRGAFELINMDTAGTLIQVDEQGRVSTTRLGDCVGRVHYANTDLTDDGQKEHIVMDSTHLRVYGADLQPLMSYELPDNIDPGFSIMLAGNEPVLGLVSAAREQLYLVRLSGSLYDDFPLRGSVAMLLTQALRKGELLVVTGLSDNTVTVYRLQ